MASETTSSTREKFVQFRDNPHPGWMTIQREGGKGRSWVFTRIPLVGPPIATEDLALLEIYEDSKKLGHMTAQWDSQNSTLRIGFSSLSGEAYLQFNNILGKQVPVAIGRDYEVNYVLIDSEQEEFMTDAPRALPGPILEVCQMVAELEDINQIWSGEHMGMIESGEVLQSEQSEGQSPRVMFQKKTEKECKEEYDSAMQQTKGIYLIGIGVAVATGGVGGLLVGLGTVIKGSDDEKQAKKELEECLKDAKDSKEKKES